MDIAFNQFDINKSKFDYEKINSLYDFYLIENKGSSFKKDSKILYEPLLNKKVLAIQYTSGASFIIMLKKDRLNKKLILDLIDKHNQEHNNNLSQKQIFAPFEKFQHSLLQLFFNSLAKSKYGDNCSNISGKLYYFSEIKSKQIYCVDFKINSDYSFSLKSKTFTEALKDSNQKSFVLQANNTLKVYDSSDKGLKQYVEYQYKNTKHAVTFANTSNLQTFESSKTGIFEKIIQKFNKTYGDLIQLNLTTESNWNKLDLKSSAQHKKEHFRQLKSILKDKTINVVDRINDEASAWFCNQLKTTYENIFTNADYFTKDNLDLSFKIKITKKEDKSALNICLIHNKEYFEINKDEKDSYKISDSSIIQNVTIEDFKQKKNHELPEASCIVLLNELVVKEDIIKNKHITIADWGTYGFDSNVIFCLCENEIINEKTNVSQSHYFFMSISPDGSFEIGEKTKDLFNQDKLEKIEEIFELNNMKTERHNKYDEKYKGLILNDKDEINIIQDSSLFMMPNTQVIYEDLKTKKLSRSKDDLIKYYGGCLDIYYKETPDCIFYSSGQIGSGMNTSVERAAHIRRIIPYKSSPLFCRESIDTMNVTFVRNGQLTMIPFPFKYLREYILIKTYKR